MKTKKEKHKKSTVRELRDIRDNIGLEIKDMNYEQLKKYIDDKLTLRPTAVWQNGK